MTCLLKPQTLGGTLGSVFYKYINPIGKGLSPRSHHLPKASLESMKGVGAETSGRRKRLKLGKVGSAADCPGLVCASDERSVWQGLDDQSEQRILELRKSLKGRMMGGLDFLLATFASTALQGHTGASYKVGPFHSSFPVWSASDYLSLTIIRLCVLNKAES